ncbi:helicase RepA family protein [Marinomonas sp. GJ51-6]|uniref:AAA family ATPase n=1 Tax=Marinomonas sp. GJ51-6 TaxID=2992802 RepID=UPI0029345628|nr:helicase RepA family protein [Marinomonas sp. GJ51-6]WOD08099.1 helicase RepA family protein [Marinomonas sp. GJ51-6]
MSLNEFKQFADKHNMPVYPTFSGAGEVEPAKGGDAIYFPEINAGAIVPNDDYPIYFNDSPELKQMVKVAINKATGNPPAANDPTGAVLEQQAITPHPIMRKPVSFHKHDPANIKPNNWLIKGYLELDCLIIAYGAPANGKSFLAIDWAACIATGKDWHGQEVKQGAVYYVAGEGFNGLSKRQAAWVKANGIQLSNAPLYTSNKAAILSELTQLQEIIAVIQGMIEETGDSPVLLIVDTLARCFSGNENSAEDMGRFISHLDMIRTHFGCSVLVVHHSGKDTDKGARGSTALKGAVDTEYSCSLAETENGKIITVKNSKMKDADTPANKSFLLEAQKLDITDENGQPFWAPALIETDYQAPLTPRLAKLGANQQKALDLIQEMISTAKEHQSSEGITTQLNEVKEEDFKQRAYQQGITTSKNYSSFIGKLEDRRFIKRQAAYIQLLEVS